jgi:hypothetical protein
MEVKEEEVKVEAKEEEEVEVEVKDSKKIKHREAVKRYYDKHKSEKQICPVCLGKITFSNKWNHRQSAIHLRHLERQKQQEQATQVAQEEDKKE